jgi:hypothetical protein
MKKMIFLSSIVIFALSTSSLAIPSKEVRCPSVESIQSASWGKIYQYEPFWMLEKAHSFYDTDDEWLFLMMYILADDEKDAIVQANEAQKTLYLQGLQPHNEHWHCVYSVSSPTSPWASASAVSPPKLDGINFFSKG